MSTYFWRRLSFAAQEERDENADEEKKRDDGYNDVHQNAPIEAATCRVRRTSACEYRCHEIRE